MRHSRKILRQRLYFAISNTMKKTAQFRFYAELNDFLVPTQRQQDICYYFEGQPAIKDAIEAIGVPHSEVDLILVNGHSVDFSYLLKDNDSVSVYPVFESLDITPLVCCRLRPLRNPQFILDVHLGTLTRYLRLLGFDCHYENNYDDKQIIHLALQQQRTILTRDVGLLKNKLVTHGYWLRNTLPKRQVAEILKRFDLLNQTKPFTRCLVCNGLIQPVPKAQIVDQLPPKTKIFYQDFYQCQACQKIYWQGAHFQKILSLSRTLQQFE